MRKKKMRKALLTGCLFGVVFLATGCSKGASDQDAVSQTGEKVQDKEKDSSEETVQATYDKDLQEILGGGLVFEVLEGSDSEMTVASYHDVALEEITIPRTVIYEEKEYSVTEIAESAFESNVLLRRIVLPTGMQTVGNSAFYACPELAEVVFSDTIVSIGASSFAECPVLSQVKLPDSLESIGAEAFSNCVSLQQMTIPANARMVDRAVFYGCEQLTECRFEQGITQVSNEMFTNCYALNKVEIPDSVTTIGVEAFWSCESLTELTLPEHVTMIGSRAFYSTGIQELRLPAGLTGVTLELLEGMGELKKITVPEAQKTSYEKLFQNYDLEIMTY